MDRRGSTVGSARLARVRPWRSSRKKLWARLPKSGFNSVAAVPITIKAPGLILQRDREAFLCFVSETPTSKTKSTLYCEPIE
jgi:hypothetical protein